MDETQLKELMDAYGNVQYKRDILSSEKQKLVESILTPQQLADIEAINSEFSAKEKAVEKEEKMRRKILDAAVEDYCNQLALSKEPVKVKSKLVAVSFAAGDVDWDTSGLDGYILAGHPELLSFRKENPPKTRITKNKF